MEVTDKMLEFMQCAFYFLLGCLAMATVLCAVVIIVYITNATINDLFGIDVCQMIGKRLRHEKL